MKIGVLDVGSNTVRLLVARVGAGSVDPLHEEREHLGLGEEVLRYGTIRTEKLEQLESVAARFAAEARDRGVRRLHTVVTAPGRQTDDPQRLVATLGRATCGAVRIVSSVEEGRLAYAGAVAQTDVPDDVVAVCDVGGGSTEVVVGTPLVGPAWVRSVDIGSLRLTAAHLASDPPTADEVVAVRTHVAHAFADVLPPVPAAALATGGSARALARVVGGSYGPEELASVVTELTARPAAQTAGRLDVPVHRARTLLAGALILAEVARLLGVRFEPARGGIREGAALQLAAERAAA